MFLFLPGGGLCRFIVWAADRSPGDSAWLGFPGRTCLKLIAYRRVVSIISQTPKDPRLSSSTIKWFPPCKAFKTFDSLSTTQDGSSIFISTLQLSKFAWQEHGSSRPHPSRRSYGRRRRPASQNRHRTRLGHMQASQDHRREGQPPRATRWR